MSVLKIFLGKWIATTIRWLCILRGQDNPEAAKLRPVKYLLKRMVLGREPEIVVSEVEYLELKRSHTSVYDAFEIELAFDLVVRNYVEIEKFLAAQLIFDTLSRFSSESLRSRQWEFIRVFSNWLATVSSWQSITRKRIIDICGRGAELQAHDEIHNTLIENELDYALIDHLRNYSQHSGFPLSGFSTGGKWNEERTKLTFSSKYHFNYEHFRHYFEADGPSSKVRKAFGKRLELETSSKPLDLKIVVRKYLAVLGKFMDEIRELMLPTVQSNEKLILDAIEKYQLAHPEITSLSGLSVIPVDERNIITDKKAVVPVRDEFILHAQELRKTNNASSLAVDKRVTTSA